MRILFIFLLFNTSKVFAQKVSLHISSESIPIPYVSVIDSKLGIVGFSDAAGFLTIHRDNCILTLTHVSYYDFHITIPKGSNDTLLIITLQPKTLLLDNVQVSQNQINKKDIFQIGSYDKKTSSRLILREKLLLGVKFPSLYNRGEPAKFLRSIKFKLGKTDDIPNKDFVLEIKIYQLKETGSIEPEPLNTIPIYVKGNNLKKHNEIIISEKIMFPENGFLISVEFPDIFDSNYDWTIPFVGDFTADVPSVYVMKNHNGKWDEEYLFNGGNKLPNGKYFLLNFTLTYWKEQLGG